MKNSGWGGNSRSVCGYTLKPYCAMDTDPPEDLRQMLVIMMECVSWVCEDALWEHERVTEPNVLWKENDIWEALLYDLDVPHPLQWRLLWFSSPSRLNRKFEYDGTKKAKYLATVNMAIEITLTVPFGGLHTPRTCLLRAVSVLPCNSQDKDWNDEEELKGGFGRMPALAALRKCDETLLFRRCVSSPCLLKQN